MCVGTFYEKFIRNCHVCEKYFDKLGHIVQKIFDYFIAL